MAKALPTCTSCGEPLHHSLCRPMIASMLADEKQAHDEDRAELVRLAAENERLRHLIERTDD